MNPATLELTQRIQVLLPRDLDPNVLRAWNGASGELMSVRLLETFGKLPEPLTPPQPKPLPPLLTALPPIEIPALARFEAKKRIKKGADGTVYVSEDFQDDFYGLTEEARPASTIYPHSTTRQARYSEMRTDLGGDQIVKATLGQIAHLAKTGKLLADGKANLFEVVNRRGVSRLVRVSWYDWYVEGGWVWYSYPVEDSFGWGAGRRVFSGNPRPVATQAA